MSEKAANLPLQDKDGQYQHAISQDEIDNLDGVPFRFPDSTRDSEMESVSSQRTQLTDRHYGNDDRQCLLHSLAVLLRYRGDSQKADFRISSSISSGKDGRLRTLRSVTIQSNHTMDAKL